MTRRGHHARGDQGSWFRRAPRPKKAKNFAEADRIRAEILEKGYTVEDTPKGPLVKKGDPHITAAALLSIFRSAVFYRSLNCLPEDSVSPSARIFWSSRIIAVRSAER